MHIIRSIAKWLSYTVYAGCAVLITLFLMPVGGWKALNVLTGSMEPALHPGDLVLIHRVPLAELKPGDIITYTNPRNPTQTITHRYVSTKEVAGVPLVTTKGDANPSNDAAFPGGRVVGRVATIIPGAGQLTNWLHNPLALAALVVIPGLIVIYAEMRTIRRLWGKKATPEQPGAPPQANLLAIPLLALLATALTATTLAATSKVAITGNSLSVTATPTPSPSPTPKPTPTCKPASSSNHVVVNNQNHQSATSGNVNVNGNTNVTGSITSGNASNSNSTTTTINIGGSCNTPTPSPTPSATPTPTPIQSPSPSPSPTATPSPSPAPAS